MSARTTRKADAEKPPVEEEDYDDPVALGTDVALAAMQALIMAGHEPAQAAVLCWTAPQTFLETRAKWVEAMDEHYGQAG